MNNEHMFLSAQGAPWTHKAGQLQRDYAEPYADLSVGLIPGGSKGWVGARGKGTLSRMRRGEGGGVFPSQTTPEDLTERSRDYGNAADWLPRGCGG